MLAFANHAQGPIGNRIPNKVQTLVSCQKTAGFEFDGQ